jgi:hypothetical protein
MSLSIIPLILITLAAPEVSPSDQVLKSTIDDICVFGSTKRMADWPLARLASIGQPSVPDVAIDRKGDC